MRDAHWLAAIKTYDSGRKANRRNMLDGGPSQLARELQQLVKSDPRRFVTLMPLIPETANPTYIDHILGGLAETSDVDASLLKTAVDHARQRSVHQHANAIIRIFERHPVLANDPSMLSLLIWYARNGEVGADTPIDVNFKVEDIVSIDDLLDRGTRLHVRGMNGPRGARSTWTGPVAGSGSDRSGLEPARRAHSHRTIDLRALLYGPAVAAAIQQRPR